MIFCLNCRHNFVPKLIIGVATIIFPQYVRKYKASEIGKKPNWDFIIIQRITGVLFVITSIVLLVLGIE